MSETQLDRIERKLDALLAKRKKPAARAKTKAQAHDEAVEESAKHFPLKGPHDYRNAFLLFCNSRKENGKYMSSLAVEALLKNLEPFSIAERIRALTDSVANGWTGVFPKADTSTNNEEEWG